MKNKNDGGLGNNHILGKFPYDPSIPDSDLSAPLALFLGLLLVPVIVPVLVPVFSAFLRCT